MKAADYDVKIRVIDSKIGTLQAQRAELVHKKKQLSEQPATKRPKPKKPSAKPSKK